MRDRAQLDGDTVAFQVRDGLLRSALPLEAEVAAAGRDRNARDRTGARARAVDVQLAVSESVVRDAIRITDQLSAEHVPVEGVGACPVGDVDHTVVELDRHVGRSLHRRLIRSRTAARPHDPTHGTTLLLSIEMLDALVKQIEARFRALEEELADPTVIGDRARFTAASRAYRDLEPAAKLAIEYRRTADDAAGARELLEDGDDPELKDLLRSSTERLEVLEEEIRLAMVERDPNDDKNVIIEIRPGVGGDEAGIWAGDIYRMLTRYAERRGLKPESLDIGDGTYTFAVKGDGAYSVFKFEGGTHRVQRVPETESQGRIHTSTATVAVLPEVDDVEVEVDQNDLQIDVYRSSGPGGQSVNTTDSAVRITHKPSGIVVSMQDEKSQLQNREKAMRVLRARLYERAIAEQQAELAASRSAQVGAGDRSEKIRTYNYGERRVKDHRINLLSHNLDGILIGELDEFTDALQDDEKRRRLADAA